MPIDSYSLSTLGEFVGHDLGISHWITVDQARIDQFADQTGDHQWIHVDVERAKRESRIGSTIAHGYLTLALAAACQLEIGVVPAGVAEALNYGLDRVRFLAPVKAGARIRDRVTLLGVESKDAGHLLLRTRNTMEIEGETRPALIADTLSLLVLHSSALDT